MNILFISPDIPYPLNYGGRIRTYHLIEELAKSNDLYVTGFGNEPEENVAMLRRFCRRVIQFPQKPWTEISLADHVRLNAYSFIRKTSVNIEHNRHHDFYPVVQAIIEQSKIDTVIAETTFTLPLALKLKHLFPTLKVILDAQNVEYLTQQRIGASSRSRLTRLQKGLAWRNIRSIEASLHEQIDSLLVTSPEDAKVFTLLNGPSLRISVVPNGVDTTYFHSVDETVDVPTLLFCGAMNYRPNEDGLLWFTEQVYPLLKKRVPQIRLLVVGRDPGDRIKQLSQDGSITVTGTVPDVRPYYGQSSIVIVPLLSGGGTRLKILEAMAMSKPVVSTTIGAEGIEKADGLLLRNTPDEMVFEIERLFKDAHNRRQLGKRNRRKVVSRYSWDMIGEQLRKYLKSL